MTPIRAIATLALALVAAAATGGAFAFPADNSVNSVQQQQQQQLQQFDQQTQAPKQQGDVVVTGPVNRAGLPPPGGATVLLKSVTFDPPSVFLTQAELDGISVQYIGHWLDFSQISALVRDVNDLYAKKGIVTASAILPPQKLSDGQLKVQLVEGKVGSVKIVGAHNTRDQYILDRVHLDRQGVVDVPQAARDITYFNKTNQAQLRLALQPGATFGLTDLSLGITEPSKTSLQFFLDNEGVESTGTYEAGVFFRGYDLAGIDDNFTIYATDSQGSLAGTVSYDLPVTTSGTRLGASYTRSRIAVISGPSAPLNVTGASQAATLTVSQPFVANTDWTVLGTFSGVYGVSSSDSGTTPLVNSETIKAVAGLSVSYTSDDINFTFAPQLIYAKANDLIASTGADIYLATGTASGTIKLKGDFSLAASAAFQTTGTQLLPGDLLFQVGGPTTVRGYSTDSVAGDSGYYAEVELHREFDQVIDGLDAFVFSDVGQVFSTFPTSTMLASAGAGMALTMGPATASVTAAFPIVSVLANQPTATVYGRLVVKAF